MAETASGPMYFLDAPDADDHVHLEASRVARFAYAPGDVAADHLTVLAVGFANGEAVAAASAPALSFIADETRLVDLELLAPGAARLETWGGEDGRRCAISEQGGQTVIFSVADDVDCDDFGNDDPLECDRFVHLARGGAQRGVDGIVGQVRPQPDATCVFATASCEDGRPGNAAASVENPWCTAPEVCDMCSMFPLNCPSAPTRLLCEARYVTDANGERTFCSDRIPLYELPAAPAYTCDDARIYDDAFSDPPAWRTQRPITDAAKLVLRTDSRCKVAIELDGTPESGPASTFVGTVALPVQGAPGAQGIVLPVQVTFVEGVCGATGVSPCAVEPGVEAGLIESLNQCLAGSP